MDIAELNNKIGYILSFLSLLSRRVRTNSAKMHHAFKAWCMVSTSGRFARSSGCNGFSLHPLFYYRVRSRFPPAPFLLPQKNYIHHAVSLRKQLFQTVRRLAGYILNGDAIADVGSVVRMALRGINVQIPDELVVDDKTLGFVFARPLRFVSQYTNYPTTNLLVFFKNFAGIGRSNCQVIFIGLLPVCFT